MSHNIKILHRLYGVLDNNINFKKYEKNIFSKLQSKNRDLFMNEFSNSLTEKASILDVGSGSSPYRNLLKIMNLKRMILNNCHLINYCTKMAMEK